MAKRWQLITVELMSGRGVSYDPPPGRMILCPLGTTFEQLGLAIDRSFGRWDLAHLRQFVLPDRTVVTDPESILKSGDAYADAGRAAITLDEVVRPRLHKMQRFEYIIDLGDGWKHRCTVRDFVDPEEVYGDRPAEPVAVFGWGSIPDQHGRRTADDTGDNPADESTEEGRPIASTTPVDVRELRGVIADGTEASLIRAITGLDIDAALQHIGCALLRVIPAGSAPSSDAAAAIQRVIDRLTARSCEGDEELVEQLRGLASRQPPSGTVLRIDLDELTLSVQRTEYGGGGCYLHTESGQTAPRRIIDEGLAEEWNLDMEDPAWRYVEFETGTWEDMADFVDSLEDARAQRRLSDAIEGRGAFRRFRDTIGDLDLVERWIIFRDDRDLGRARAALAELDIRPV